MGRPGPGHVGAGRRGATRRSWATCEAPAHHFDAVALTSRRSPDRLRPGVITSTRSPRRDQAELSKRIPFSNFAIRVPTARPDLRITLESIDSGGFVVSYHRGPRPEVVSIIYFLFQNHWLQTGQYTHTMCPIGRDHSLGCGGGWRGRTRPRDLGLSGWYSGAARGSECRPDARPPGTSGRCIGPAETSP